MKALVIAVPKYNGHELWVSLGVLQQEGIEFEVVSSTLRIEDEVDGTQNRLARTLDGVRLDELGTVFDGLMFVSGSSKISGEYYNHPKVLALVEAAKEADLPVAAICAAVPIIRNIAAGKRVSFFPLVRSRILLQEAGAILQTTTISLDGNLVTAEHQGAATTWAELFSRLIKGEPAELHIVDSGFVPHGSERKPIPVVEAIKRKHLGHQVQTVDPDGEKAPT